MKILLIDDDVESLASLSLALRTKGYLSKGFINPVDAVQAFREDNYDLVITDIRMPKMDGIKVLEKVKEIRPDVSVIVITAFDDVEYVRAAEKGGADAFYCKPLNIKSLLNFLSTLKES